MNNRNRGKNTGDNILFGTEKQLDKLKQGIQDMLYLLSRGYPEKASSELVGNRYRLQSRQIQALRGGSASNDQIQLILIEEHQEKLEKNLRMFRNGILSFDLPYFNEEIKKDSDKSFNTFINILDNGGSVEIEAKKLEEIPFEYWLDVLGQRLTSASIRTEKAIPPPEKVLVESCQKLYNEEITIAQRAWEKHVGRTDDPFWGEIKGNNR